MLIARGSTNAIIAKATSEFQKHSHFQNEARCTTFLVEMSWKREIDECM